MFTVSCAGEMFVSSYVTRLFGGGVVIKCAIVVGNGVGLCLCALGAIE